MKEYDYSSPGAYFVTIDTYQQECTFGEIISGRMNLSDLGRIAEQCLIEIPEHFPQTLIQAHVVMPNHIHAIITIIEEPCTGTDARTGTNPSMGTIYRAHTGVRGTHTGDIGDASKTEKFGKPVSGSIPTIVRTYKSAVSRIARKELSCSQVWHRGYYERVVRDQVGLEAIAAYIQSNPVHRTREPGI